MSITTKLGPKITLEIPKQYYRKLSNLRYASDNGHNRTGLPITNDHIYHCFRTLMEKLIDWLLDQTKNLGGYRTGAFRILEWTDNKMELQVTDNPFDAFWTNNVVDYISDQYRFGGLLEQWQNDP